MQRGTKNLKVRSIIAARIFREDPPTKLVLLQRNLLEWKPTFTGNLH